MFPLRSLILWLTLSAAAGATGVTFERVWPGYRTSESFTRIGEYFGGEESHPGQTVLRSRPADRAGYYWLVRTRAETAHPDTRLVLEIVPAGSATVVRHEFSSALPAGSHPLLLGLTGADWPGASHRPTAWRLTLQNARGQALVTVQSFLWRTSNP
jgi:hypothetical protein